MICGNCRLAGDMIARYRAEKRLKNAEFTIKSMAFGAERVFGVVAGGLHGLCSGCDCQHILDWEGKSTNAIQEPGPNAILRKPETGNRSSFRTSHLKEEYEKLAGEGGPG